MCVYMFEEKPMENIAINVRIGRNEMMMRKKKMRMKKHTVKEYRVSNRNQEKNRQRGLCHNYTKDQT